MSSDGSGPAVREYETLPTVPCDIWIAGFVMQYEHLYHLCGAHGLTKEEIDRQEPLPAARRIMKGWRGGVDLIEVRTISGDGSRHIDFLLVLLVSPQLRGEKAPLHLLRYDPKYAEILPTIFPPEYVSSNERLFPQGRLPWVRMPWPLYLYVTPCVLRELDRFTANERARARRMALDAAAGETPSGAPDGSVSAVDIVASEAQEKFSATSGSKTQRGQEDSRIVHSGKRART
ncbi:hypothetical protein OH76DRAFT_550412 [Lentinus brumalis]|uniref:Uncharacterized protein n=1 Tax=Lentinus brumalis TaxID=2498619 RepID=A0A371D9Z2_9APHY|nr:hypothetical protein OH76DRAFT_550412 [Polyporus brumalis]